MNIFQVISNINHNGTVLSAGQFIEGELAEFEHLVQSGAMKVIDGAKSIEHAQAIVDSQKQEAVETAPVAPQAPNTWGPKKDEPELPANDDTQSGGTGDMAPKTTEQVGSDEDSSPQITGDEL